MCILIHTTGDGNTPTKDALITACDNNPDGFGWAIVYPTEIWSHRTMDAAQAVNSYLNAMAAVEGRYPSLFHARITTHGITNVENCHPFKVGDHQTMLAHNGIITNVPDMKDGRSDTRTFAEDWLPQLGLEMLDDPDEFDQLERFIGASKIVVLTTDPRLKHSTYILNESYGKWENGIWYSNSSHRESYQTYTTSYSHGGGWSENREWTGWRPSQSTFGVIKEADGREFYFRKDEEQEQLDPLFCDFCNEYFLSADDYCPQCDMCAICDHWNCRCGKESALTPEDGGEWIPTEWELGRDWFQNADGALLLWDNALEQWRPATNAECDIHIAMHGPLWSPLDDVHDAEDIHAESTLFVEL